jgi:hypothetical protein
MGALNGKIAGLVGALIFIVLAIALAPTMFNGSNNISGAPGWLGSVLPLLIGAGLVYGVWRSFN